MRTLGKLVTGLLATNIAFCGPIYSVADLGSLGGESTAYRINNRGEAVGWSLAADGEYHAFLATGGQMIDLGSGRAYSINDHGQIAGASYSSGEAVATLWNSGPIAGTESWALDINDRGDVVGGQGHAFLLSRGRLRDLGTLPGGGWSAAYGIADSGDVAGYGDVAAGNFHAFLWNARGGMLDLGTLGGANSYALAINERGEVVGASSVADGYLHAFLYADGRMQDLGTLEGGSSFAYGINSAGRVVGYSWVHGVSHAFLFRDGLMIDLNILLPAGSGWELLAAHGINHPGQIVGEGMYQGRLRAFRLDPEAVAAPEPGAVWMLLLGVGIFLGRRLVNYSLL